MGQVAGVLVANPRGPESGRDQYQRRPGANVKLGTMPRAGDRVVRDFAFAQRPAVVSAHIVDAVVVAVNMQQDYEPVV